MNDSLAVSLQNIVDFPSRQRITREITSLIEKNGYDKNDIDFYIEHNRNGTINNVLTIYDKDTRNFYSFHIPKNYPFNPPKLIINGKPYLHYLKITSDIFKSELYKYSNSNCFCCSSLLCNANWTPVKSIINIIQEFNTYRNICKKIYFILIVNKLKKKYLIDNINILEWLY
jgi:ubiquitin-protein ligase